MPSFTLAQVGTKVGLTARLRRVSTGITSEKARAKNHPPVLLLHGRMPCERGFRGHRLRFILLNQRFCKIVGRSHADGHDSRDADDLMQREVSSAAEWNDQLPMRWIAGCLAKAERRHSQSVLSGRCDSSTTALCSRSSKLNDRSSLHTGSFGQRCSGRNRTLALRRHHALTPKPPVPRTDKPTALPALPARARALRQAL